MNERLFKFVAKNSVQDKKPTTQRDKTTARRRLQILDAAVHCFLELGYHQTGVREIAARAGVSLGNLYNYFQGKHDILVEIAALEHQENEPFLTILNSTTPAPKILNRFITAYTKYLAQPENVILSLEITSEAIRQPDIAELFVTNRQEIVNALTKVLDRGMTEGAFRQLPDSAAVALLIVTLIEGSAYNCTLGKVAIRKVLKSTQDFIDHAVMAH